MHGFVRGSYFAFTPYSVEWRDEDSSGAMAAGWSKDNGSTVHTSRAPATPMGQWETVNEVSWGNKVKVSA